MTKKQKKAKMAKRRWMQVRSTRFVNRALRALLAPRFTFVRP